MSKMIGREPDTLNSFLINISYYYESNNMDYILILFNIHKNYNKYEPFFLSWLMHY